MEWFETDRYYSPYPNPSFDRWGPKGPALVRVYEKSGTTAPGWGADSFMRNYNLGRFKTDDWLVPFAYVMRAYNGLVIDIDGKNGGIDQAKQLNLTPTLAETSKSNTGYHLWYSMPHGYEWDSLTGYAPFSDKIGLVPGVDVKVTGCVFHYPHQAWNSRLVSPVPTHILNKIEMRESIGLNPQALIELAESGDPVEVKRLVNDALESLSKPIPHGRRNQTLFAIGSRLFLLAHENWDELIESKAEEIGLDYQEVRKLINNIQAYAERA